MGKGGKENDGIAKKLRDGGKSGKSGTLKKM